ncbi:hypothetical protein L345_11587, partial [Ophiophagus hannah]
MPQLLFPPGNRKKEFFPAAWISLVCFRRENGKMLVLENCGSTVGGNMPSPSAIFANQVGRDPVGHLVPCPSFTISDKWPKRLEHDGSTHNF